MSPADLIIGIDVGTTSIKGGLFTPAGTALASASTACESIYPRTGWAEQDPRKWVTGIHAIVAELLAAADQAAEVDPGAVIAAGICSQVNTHVFVDADLNPLAPAMTWQDQRCADVAESLRELVLEQGLEIPIDSSALLSRAQWFRQQRPDDWQRTRWILSPKDFCIAALSGAVATDALSSIGLVTDQGRYIDALDTIVPGVSQRLPSLHAPTASLGKLSSAAMPLNCPVVVGTMDAWACLYGSGSVRVGDGFEIAGTSEIIGTLSADGTPGNGVVNFPPQDGVCLYAGPTQCGGDSLTWLAGVLQRTIPQTLALAAGSPDSGDQLLFLPHLLGERAPLWNPRARGAFVGLSKTHGPAHLARAVLEGVGFSARQLREAIETAAGFELSSLRISGGGSRSDLWCQVKANIHGKTLARVANVDTGSFGAALLAAVGAGAYPDIITAADSAVRIDREFFPQAGSRQRYDELYALYRRSYAALETVFADLEKVPAGPLQ
jgi:xylulokinase